jgi:aminopeptidase N
MTRLEDYKKPNFSLDFVDLEFQLDFQTTIVSAKLNFSNLSGDLELFWEHGKVLEFQVDGVETPFSKTLSGLPKECELFLKTEIYPEKNSELSGLYKSGDILVTQNEAEGFRRIIPFPDRPDVMSKYRVKLIGDKTLFPKLLSNGNLIESGDLGEKHYAVWIDPFKKPSYLFAVVGGDLDFLEGSFKTMSGRDVKLHFYTDKGRSSDATFAMESLQKAMRWDEERFGLEYDLDIYQVVAVSSFNMGAMENKGLNIFNSAYLLANSKKATDTDYLNIESVIAHEYFHNWTGNRVTVRDWFQLTLKEGLTVFRDQLFSEDMRDPIVQRISDIERLQKFQFPEDASPNSHPIKPTEYLKIDNFYTFTIYEKGAEVIRTLHTMLGEERFQDGMKLYFERHDGEAVTTEDFLSAMADASGEDLRDFTFWYSEKGTPKIGYAVEPTDKGIEIAIFRESEHKAPFPLEIRIYDGEEQLISKRSCTFKDDDKIYLRDDEEEFDVVLDTVAPVILESVDCLPENENPILLYRDFQNKISDGLLYLQKSRILAVAKALNKDKKEVILDVMIEMLRNLNTLLNERPQISDMLKSKMLTIQNMSSVFQKVKRIDVLELYNALEYGLRIIRKEFRDELVEKIEKLGGSKADDLSNSAIGKRAYQNALLELLDDREIAKDIYWNSDTMTEKMVAMKVAKNDEVFQDFLEKFGDDTDMVSKYFSIVAGDFRENPIPKIEQILKSELFNYNVPNLVRGLLGSFGRNYKYLFTIEGMELFSRELEKVDRINHHTSARLCESLNLYPKLKKEYQKIVREAIEPFYKSETISENSFEILNKIFK